MRVLLASIPATGHFNPLLVVANILKKAGHETAFYTSTLFHEKIEAAGSRFFPLPDEVDQRWLEKVAGLLKRFIYAPSLEEGAEIFKTVFVEPMPAQFHELQKVLKKFPADLIVFETSFAGVFPLLLGPRSARPVCAYLGISASPLDRADGAPWGPGLMPTEDPEKLKEYAEIAREVNEKKEGPLTETADRLLAELGLPGLPGTVFASGALLADIILQPCAPSFEFPLREPAKKVHFIGALLPQGAGDVPPGLKEAKDAGRKIVLVSQGTIANNDLGKLLAPAIQALGEREDFLILATTGGKPIENIPCALTPNTVASKYLNFGKVMPYVDVLIAFGSYGTVTQALSLGVPMVVAGRGEDKPEVGARVTATGCGIYLATDTPSPEQIRDAVDQILAEPEYRANSEKLRREFAAHSAEQELTTLLEALVEDQQVLVS
ncbi:MGT family glycosyltransferase [Silvibacterium bohemicum]|uniref:MGT family glycosyltransferase n=1 Tax=Silvibacterium bohemicum TaxID=1577686 RepID=A0A841K2Y9_9BACT|nr:nucleotide disphospho-sugar-binding domain-containing protein [Silvibacterium bohemicum]MBB6147395.1 MGT family glycosyltransferase [Silvibacterium bohemicum]